ncbi:EF-hand domain-containing protein [Balamuthia mandrillaris]
MASVGAKRTSEVALEENTKENAAPQSAHAAHLEAILDEFDLEVETRSAALMSEARDLCSSLKNQLHVELMKLPKRIREMPMKEFIDKHGGDINELHKNETIRIQSTPLRGLLASTHDLHSLFAGTKEDLGDAFDNDEDEEGEEEDHEQNEDELPQRKKKIQGGAKRPARGAKGTTTQKNRDTARATIDARGSSKIRIQLGEQEVDVDDLSSMDTMTAKERKMAMEQLKLLHQHVASLIMSDGI